MTVGIGTGFDEEAVKRDLATIAAVEQAEAEKSDVWCEEHPPRVDGRTPWRTEEVSCLKAAMHAVAAGTPGRWNMIAEMVPGRDASDCKGRGSKLNTHKAGALIPSTDMLSESSEDEANVEDGESCSEGCDGDEVERLKECIENFPTDGERSELGELFDDLGRALKAMGDDSGAEKAWRDGTRRVPAHFRCYAGLARMLRSRNDLMGAESIVRKGLKLELHEENDCLLELAAIQATRGDHARAEETYRKAMSAMPGTGWHTFNSVKCLKSRRIWAGLRACIERVSNSFPTSQKITPNSGATSTIMGSWVPDSPRWRSCSRARFPRTAIRHPDKSDEINTPVHPRYGLRGGRLP